MKQFWQNLQERDRWALILGGGAVLIYLGYLLLFAPLLNAVRDKQLEVLDKQETMQWMQKVSNQARQLKGRTTTSNSQLLTLITQQLKQDPSLSFPYQLQQTSSGEIQLNFEEVAFNAVIEWLGKLADNYQITLKQFNAERLNTAGMAKLQIIITA